MLILKNNYLALIEKFLFFTFLLFAKTYANANTNDEGIFSMEYQDTYKTPISVLSIQGKISKNLYSMLQSKIDNLGDRDSAPGKFLVLLDSMGGDAEAAIKIGELLRKKNAFIFVTNRCASACVFIYAAGIYRSSIPVSIGIHAPRLVINNKNLKKVEIRIENNEIARKKLADFNENTKEYLKEMDINDAFFDRLQSLNSDKIIWLTANELKFYGLDGFESNFWKNHYQKFKSDLNLDQPELLIKENIDATLSRCSYVKNIPQRFAQCYLKSLRGETIKF